MSFVIASKIIENHKDSKDILTASARKSSVRRSSKDFGGAASFPYKDGDLTDYSAFFSERCSRLIQCYTSLAYSVSNLPADFKFQEIFI